MNIRPRVRAIAALCVLLVGGQSVAAQQTKAALDGAALYRTSCAACHGQDGKGPPPARKLAVPPPDFTDCSFASREADADWTAVIHQGGPVRAFNDAMPAFGEGLSLDQIQAILDHIRTLCSNRRWPRGELNLPRALHIEKAYPEDEAVSTLTVSTRGPNAIVNEIVYERRFGASTQLELKFPFGATQETALGGWGGGIGDIVLGLKQVLHHSLASGTIFSLGAEVKAPTGSTSNGLGSGTWIAEPFAAFGKALPSDAFIQLLAEVELPAQESKSEREAAAGAVLGRTFTQSNFGRAWTPMVELLAARELESGHEIEWDIIPQLQVSLSKRQHVLASFGTRIPLTERSRPAQFMVYVLWDWFDGGFFDGW
jgi:mono/diheme cytochrome c family protein